MPAIRHGDMVDASFSIVIPTFNRKVEAWSTLLRLRRNAQVPYEVILVDNSDTQTHFPDLLRNERYIHLGANFGAAARNLGLQEARAPYVLMLDDDSHPAKGTLKCLLRIMERLPPEVAGVSCRVVDPDGVEQSAALPTAFHGAGAAFRTARLREAGGYPKYFVYYGEEYWATLALYARGCRMAYAQEAVIVHRSSETNRDLARIFYCMTRNNAVLWRTFLPPPLQAAALYDTFRRYELIARKEGVASAYRDGRLASWTHPESYDGPMLTLEAFEHFALFCGFRELMAREYLSDVLLCGCGKFPTMWADFLVRHGVGRVSIADRNPALIGQVMRDYRVLSPSDGLRRVRQGAVPVVAHTSILDSRLWTEYLQLHGCRYAALNTYHAWSGASAEQERAEETRARVLATDS